MGIAFVASVYNETQEIIKQLADANMSHIQVYPYGSEPEGYEVIEYDVRPDKTHGEILDLAQCISTHGFPDDEYIPPTRSIYSDQNNQLIDEATKHLSLDRLEATLEDGMTQISREGYLARIEEIINTKKRFTEMGTRELSSRIEFEEDPMVIIAMFTVLFDKIHCEDMIDNWGNPTRGYHAKNGKDVKGFMNPKSIGWISELWSDLLPKQSPYNIRKYLKSLRTRGKNMLKDKSSIYGLRFFIEYLIEQDTENIMPESEQGATDVVFEGFEESDIPFSILLVAPLLSLSTYLEWYNILI